MNTIRQEYGFRYWSHSEAVQKAADLWELQWKEFETLLPSDPQQSA
jgi:hypothetical protein